MLPKEIIQDLGLNEERDSREGFLDAEGISRQPEAEEDMFEGIRR